MQNYTLLLDDVMEEHTQALFLCVSVCAVRTGGVVRRE